MIYNNVTDSGQVNDEALFYDDNLRNNAPFVEELLTFNLKLHWVAGACWQEEWRERKWCLQCEGVDCSSGDILELEVCNNFPQQRFQWISTGDDTGRLKHAYSDLCLHNSGGLRLRPCSGSRRQIFRRSSMDNVFELYPLGSEDRCLSQVHHPKAGEELIAEDCFLARKFLTSKWHIYQDSAGSSDPNDDGYPGINNDGRSGPQLSLRGNCNNANPCGMCEGDCNDDRNCEGNLRCFRREAMNFVPGCSGHGVFGQDYCYLPPEGRAGDKGYHAFAGVDFDDRRQLRTN